MCATSSLVLHSQVVESVWLIHAEMSNGHGSQGDQVGGAREPRVGVPVCQCCMGSCLRRRGRWMQADTDADAFEVAQLQDWERLMDFYGDDEMLSCDHPAARRAMDPFLFR